MLFCILLSVFSHTSFAKQKTISGKVLDADTRQPLPSLIIAVSGTNTTL